MPDPKGIVQSNPANNTEGRHNRSFSTFDESLSYTLFNTLRFGEYTPSFEMEGVPTDEISLNSKDVIDSLSLNAPFKTQIRKIKESYSIPYMAILPRNWDLIYAQPSNGDDVPNDANCVLSSAPETIFNLLSWMIRGTYAAFGNANVTKEIAFTCLLRLMVIGEYFYSHGSLLNVSGYKCSAQFRFLTTDRTRVLSYDEWFDEVCAAFFSKVTSLSVVDGRTNRVVGNYFGLAGVIDDYHVNKSFRQLLNDFRENPALVVSVINFTAVAPALDMNYLTLGNFVHVAPVDAVDADDITSLSSKKLNLSRILAYQLVCAHFYTNSAIDFVYTAELYRQYCYILMKDATINYLVPTFNINGFSHEYDIFSGHNLAGVFLPLSDNSWFEDVSTNRMLSKVAFFAAVFAYRRSLRYGDYFVGSRPRPLAPVNTDVSVNNNKVSVVDVTRNIQAQRFANAVMRSRSKIEEYVKSLFGKAPAPDYHNPFFLTRQEEMVFGDDVQNTAESQFTDPNSRTANFSSMVDNHTFTFHNDDSHPCIYMQLISFDVRRAYTRSVERQFLHSDRYDMFNPDFQYIGDQPIYGIELGYPYNGTIPAIFGYTNRDQEYKQRFDQAAGGFVQNLPGWILTDNFRSFDDVQSISPDFIRSYPAELDQFFLSLTGFSLGSYFHFICITRNNVSAKRPMAVDPQILA